MTKEKIKGHRSGNQYTSGKFDREANARRYIDERTPWFEYAGGFTGVDGHVDLKCKTCGAIVRRSFVVVKHGKARCDKCAARRTEQNREQKERARQAKANKRTLDKRISGTQIAFKECECCGSLFVPHRDAKYCSDECVKKVSNARRGDKRLRRLQNAMEDNDITLQKLYKRDNGKCYICGEDCNWEDYNRSEEGYFFVGKMYPTIEHVIPLSKGGKHSWGNVKLACWGCNTNKGAKYAPRAEMNA